MNHTWPAQLAAGRWPLQADALRTADAYAGERRPSRSAALRAGRLPFAAQAASPPNPAAACSPLGLLLLGCVRGAPVRVRLARRPPALPAPAARCRAPEPAIWCAPAPAAALRVARWRWMVMPWTGTSETAKQDRVCYVLLAGWALGFTLLGRHTLFLGPTREEPDASSSSTSSRTDLHSSSLP